MPGSDEQEGGAGLTQSQGPPCQMGAWGRQALRGLLRVRAAEAGGRRLAKSSAV